MQRRDMTQGSIWKQLILFSIPILLGNLLQQLYNAFDAIVVGRFVGKEALAAVGSSGNLINMIIAFFMGMSTGSSVLISQYYGARDRQSLHDTIHTAMLLSVILGIILSIIGIVLSPTLLRLTQTPEEVMPSAIIYLRVFFSGMVFLTIYNMGTAVLRALGDSRRPLYFLILSAVLNITLNLLFVLTFDMGVAGVAWSTVIAQAVSAVLVVWVMCRAQGDDRLILRDLRLNLPICKKIAALGLPGGIQQSIISVSNMIVQSYINVMGSTVSAGYSAGSKLDAFIMLPAQSMAMSVTTFVGQNLGAHKVKRARKGAKASITVGISITIFLSIIVFIFGKTLLQIFTTDPEVLEAGYAFMQIFVPTYFLLCFTQVIPGALRGAGDVRVPTFISIFSFVVLRQIYLFIATRISHTILIVTLGYPLTWAVAATALIIYYRKSDWSRFARADVVETD